MKLIGSFSLIDTKYAIFSFEGFDGDGIDFLTAKFATVLLLRFEKLLKFKLAGFRLLYTIHTEQMQFRVFNI